MADRLRDRAAAMADRGRPDSLATALPVTDTAPPITAESEPLPDIEYTGEIPTFVEVPVHIAWARVMADVQSIGKGDRMKPPPGERGPSFMYRGYDRVINAVGPALRRHGVVVTQVGVVPSYRDVTTSKGNKMRECTVIVTYEIRGPMNDTMPSQSAGEAFDSGDKATTKACTIAYRNMLLTALSIPTRDPRLDAEASNVERGEQPLPDPAVYRDEIVDKNTSLGRLRAIRTELDRLGMSGVEQQNEVGDDEQLGVMVRRIGKTRQEQSQ